MTDLNPLLPTEDQPSQRRGAEPGPIHDVPGAFQAGTNKSISFTLNGRAVTRVVDTRESLADMLRNDVGMNSVKKGCEVGECGACSVLIDGEAVNSCLYLAAWADGRDLRTVEGLASPEGDLSLVQQAFVDAAAVQCGFCTPGILLTATELLERHRPYTREELRVELSGHLCRCTGYENILRAVENAVEANLRGEPMWVDKELWAQLPTLGNAADLKA